MHEKILSQIGEFHRGDLSAVESAVVKRHLASCSECREVASRWKDLPAPAGFSQKVMDLLEKTGSPEKTLLWRWAIPLIETAAAAMVIAAFWHPEKSWVNSDKSFAWTDRSHSISTPYRPYPPERHNE